MTAPESQPRRDETDLVPTGEPTGTSPQANQGRPSAEYEATMRLIRSRLADAERSRAKPWWKLRP